MPALEQTAKILVDAMARTTNALALRALADRDLFGSLPGWHPNGPQRCAKTRIRFLPAPWTGPRTRVMCGMWRRGSPSSTQRFHPARASVVCGIAVKMLIRGMTETIRPLSIGGFALGVIRMAPHLTPEQCAAAAWELITVIPQAEATYGQGQPEKHLAAIVMGGPPQVLEQNINSVAFAVGGLGNSGNLLPALAFLHPSLRPQPQPLPPQLLVDLLKHPLCVGKSRRKHPRCARIHL